MNNAKWTFHDNGDFDVEWWVPAKKSLALWWEMEGKYRYSRVPTISQVKASPYAAYTFNFVEPTEPQPNS